MGILLGVGLLVAGGLEFIVSMNTPAVGPISSTSTYGPVGGNLPEIIGFVLLAAGISVISGIVSVSIWRHEGGQEEEFLR